MPSTIELCTPDHREGGRPTIVPVAGCTDTYVIYHGHDYLDANGDVDHRPDRMTYGEAVAAIQLHREACEIADEAANGHVSETPASVG